MEPHTDKYVANYSTYTLDQDHISLLSKGLKFCPSPGKPDTGELREDMDRLHTRLRQIAFFENPEDKFDPKVTNKINSNEIISKELEPFEHQKFKLKSNFKGAQTSPNLEAFIIANEKDFNDMKPCKKYYKQNVTKNERLALKALMENNNIIIRPADKGSAVVILDREAYLKEGFKQLSNANFYKYLDHNPTSRFEQQINDIVEDMYQNGEIGEKCKSFLTSTHGRTSELYLLPKIHKSTFSKENPVSRPIMSANGCPTEKISQFVDHFLNPTMLRIPAYIRDTTDFLNNIRDFKNLPPQTLLVTLDVESLYTNIPHEYGIQAAKIALNTHRSGKQNPTNISLLKLLRIVLSKNNFQFNGTNFLQIQGTAMGSVSVSYAKNSLGLFEEQHVYTYKQKPFLYVRFIDDIFIV